MVEIILAVVLLVIIFHIFRGSDTDNHTKNYKYDKHYTVDTDDSIESTESTESYIYTDNDTEVMPTDDINKNRWATLEQSTTSLIPESVLSNKMCGTDVSGINLDKYVKSKLDDYAFGNKVTGSNSFYDNKFESGAVREGTMFNDEDSYSIFDSKDDMDKKYRDQHFSFHDKINGSSSEAVDPVDKMNSYLFNNDKAGLTIQEIFDGMTR